MERSTPCGCSFSSHRSRGVAPKTRGPGIASNPTTPPGCRTIKPCGVVGKKPVKCGEMVLGGAARRGAFFVAVVLECVTPAQVVCDVHLC